ncbi:MAG: DUF4373 domain-containing protein [Bacteroidales bacterium]|nr:DUF4373 domain-containing protein [Bacteroidales bacterium]
MTRKDAYYFPHDSNAKDDPKIVLLIDQLGCEGYGIFWILIELLRDQDNYRCPLKMIPPIAKRYNTSKEKMGLVISEYDLFKIEGDEFFFSESLNRRMQYMEELRQKRIEAGRKGGKSKASNAKANLQHCSTSKLDENKKNDSRSDEKISDEMTNYNNQLFECIDISNLNEIEKQNRFEEIKTELLNSHMWIENTAAALKTDFNKVADHVVAFCDILKAREDYGKPFSEIKRHAVNWMRIRKEKIKKINGNPKPTYEDLVRSFIETGK